ncbi:MAG: phosphotransferase [Deltaproteobacteria bacterium]|nr:phosphotransferase [Deltaproteobacteria bacterium]
MKNSVLNQCEGGLINTTFTAENSLGKWIIQKVSNIFDSDVTDNIKQVTRHLKKHSVPTINIVESLSGKLSITIGTEVFRVLDFIPGKHPDVENAYECGKHLSIFHKALSDADFTGSTRELHNTVSHMLFLKSTIEKHQSHRLLSQVITAANSIDEMYSGLKKQPKVSSFVHGDPKRENFFIYNNQILLLDLDTCGYHDFGGEIGDALRGWSNIKGNFDKKVFTDFLEGYNTLAVSDSDRISNEFAVNSTIRIALELAARFAADALNESYFGWDSAGFSSRGEHNMARAYQQIYFAKQLLLNKEI